MRRGPELLCALLRLSLLPAAIRMLLQRRSVTILMYHAPSAATMRRHLRVLTRAYNLVELGDVATALESGNFDSLPPRPLAITLDDGHRSNAELGDVFASLQARPTIFLCAGLVDSDEPFWFNVVPDSAPFKLLEDEERRARVATLLERAPASERQALSAAEVDRLKGVVDFQAHTLTHPILPRCSDPRAKEEIAGSKAVLERLLKDDVFAFAYPNGDHTERELRMVREAGYRCAVTTSPGVNRPGCDPFRLRRIPVDDDRDGASVVLVKSSGLWAAARRVLRRFSR